MKKRVKSLTPLALVREDADLPLITIEVEKRKLHFKSAGLTKSYPVAVGKPSTPTPLGDWTIIQKAMNPGGRFGARWMRLSVPWGGYGIHGTNNPSSIGKAVSHGCVRMYNKDVIEIYPLTPLGTPVQIVGRINSQLTPITEQREIKVRPGWRLPENHFGSSGSLRSFSVQFHIYQTG